MAFFPSMGTGRGKLMAGEGKVDGRQNVNLYDKKKPVSAGPSSNNKPAAVRSQHHTWIPLRSGPVPWAAPVHHTSVCLIDPSMSACWERIER